MKFYNKLTSFILIFFCCFLQAQDDSLYSNIYKFRALAKDQSLTFNKRFEYAKKAISLSKQTKQDTTVLASNRILSYIYLLEGVGDSIYKINKENLRLSKKLDDTLKMAFATNNIAYSFELTNKPDSAYYYYYQAEKYYSQLNRKLNQIEVLYAMASIQETERDFIGSEINAIEAIKILNDLEEDEAVVNEWQWNINNLLAIISSRIELYDEAITYHNKALSYTRNKDANPYNALFSKINIAILQRRKKDFDKSIEIFESLLEDQKLKSVDPLSYVTVISNLAYVKFLKGDKNYNQIIERLKEALKIANDEDDEIEISGVSKFLSEVYLKANIKDSALYYSNQSLKVAKQINANQTILDALLLKSKIETGKKSNSSLFQYIKLSDSLVLAERSISNKFARIYHETDVIKREKEAVSRQNMWLLITTIGLLILVLFIYIIKTQREKNKELQLARQQQQANEEIYNLMLLQQDKMDEARALEKKRISQEIHDGILGRLFGARLSLDSLNMLKTDDAIQNRESYINELKDIEQDIRKVSHELNTDFIANASFESLITTLVETQCLAYQLTYNLALDHKLNWDILPNKTKIHLYRIIQESLQNIYKHANARLVSISIKQKKNLISLTINDDGVGFDLARNKEGIGLKNMKSRVQQINGVFTVNTEKNKGTNIKIDVPI